jgi:pilus assembly protein Flp/PilA
MNPRRKAIRGWLAADDGPTTVEYAVMLALILVAAFGAIRSLGGGAEGKWKTNADKIQNAIQGAPGGG